MNTKKYGHEVVINFNEQEKKAVLYCSDPEWMLKMSQLARANPDIFDITKITEESLTFEFPKKLVKIKLPKKKMKQS